MPDFLGCLRGQKAGSLLILFDTTGSLESNDPDKRRADAAKALIAELSAFAKENSVQLDAAVTGFGWNYQPEGAWSTLLGASGSEAIDARIDAVSSITSGTFESDFWAALDGAQTGSPGARPADGADRRHTRCQALLWFTDGEFHLRQPHEPSSGQENYNEREGVCARPPAHRRGQRCPRATQKGLDAICADGGPADQLRAANVTIWSIGLSPADNPDKPDLSLLQRVAEGVDSNGKTCGALRSPPGRYFRSTTSTSWSARSGCSPIRGPAPQPVRAGRRAQRGIDRGAPVQRAGSEAGRAGFGRLRRHPSARQGAGPGRVRKLRRHGDVAMGRTRLTHGRHHPRQPFLVGHLVDQDRERSSGESRRSPGEPPRQPAAGVADEQQADRRRVQPGAARPGPHRRHRARSRRCSGSARCRRRAGAEDRLHGRDRIRHRQDRARPTSARRPVVGAGRPGHRTVDPRLHHPGRRRAEHDPRPAGGPRARRDPGRLRIGAACPDPWTSAPSTGRPTQPLRSRCTVPAVPGFQISRRSPAALASSALRRSALSRFPRSTTHPKPASESARTRG